MNGIETGLDKMFKVVPSLPEGFRKGLATALPWISLAGGILSLIGCWYLYQAAVWVGQIYNYADSLYTSLGYSSAATGTGASMFIWVSLALLAAQAVMFLVAFPSLQKHKKMGWSLLLWAAFINIIYDVIYSLFGYGYMNFGQLIMYLVGVLISLYFLFQVRPYFMGAGAATAAKPMAKR